MQKTRCRICFRRNWGVLNCGGCRETARTALKPDVMDARQASGLPIHSHWLARGHCWRASDRRDRKAAADANPFDTFGGVVSGPCVDILVSHDIVLSKVTAGRYFDQTKRQLSGVFESMNFTKRNVDGLVFTQQLHRAADRDRG